MRNRSSPASPPLVGSPAPRGRAGLSGSPATVPRPRARSPASGRGREAPLQLGPCSRRGPGRLQGACVPSRPGAARGDTRVRATQGARVSGEEAVGWGAVSAGSSRLCWAGEFGPAWSPRTVGRNPGVSGEEGGGLRRGLCGAGALTGEPGAAGRQGLGRGGKAAGGGEAAPSPVGAVGVLEEGPLGLCGWARRESTGPPVPALPGASQDGCPPAEGGSGRCSHPVLTRRGAAPPSWPGFLLLCLRALPLTCLFPQQPQLSPQLSTRPPRALRLLTTSVPPRPGPQQELETVSVEALTDRLLWASNMPSLVLPL